MHAIPKVCYGCSKRIYVWCLPPPATPLALSLPPSCFLPNPLSLRPHSTSCLSNSHLISSLDGYCSTVQGLLDWFEVDLGFTEHLFIQIDLCATSSLCNSHLISSLSYSHFISSLKHLLLIKYGVATVSRIDKIISLFCKRAL